MAHAYTPGLKVLHHAVVRKIRQLPLKGEVHLKVGDPVEPDTVVASTRLPGNVNMVNIAGLLNIEAETCPDCLTVELGQDIREGEVIAESPGIFGLFKSRCSSPINGTLESISAVTGQAVLREPPIPVEVDAYTSGTVVEIIPEEGLIVETRGVFIQAIFGIGGENRGTIKVIVENPDQPISSDRLTADLKGCVVVGGSHISLDAYQKAQTLGIAAVVTGGFNYNDLESILGYSLGVAITGSEELGTSLLVTEGFGQIAMARRTFDLLGEHEGRYASVNGSTQIRAGVIRPEILIPLNTPGVDGPSGPGATAGGIGIDSIVRVIRAPYFGILGRVTELPPELQVMESESVVRVARVKLETGEELLLPRANLELLETD